MKKDITKLAIVTVNESKNSLKSLSYILAMYPVDYKIKIALTYILPSLPPILVEESKRNRQTAKQLKLIEEKNLNIANRILDEAHNYLLRKGFRAEHIEKIIESKRVGIARDINSCVEKRLADTLIISSSGKGWLEGFFTGEVTNKLVEIIRICPIWVIKGDVKQSNVLIAMDGSQNSLRSVDHAGFMLAGTKNKITLMHVTSSLSRFFPKEALEGLEAFEDVWSQETETAIKQHLNNAKEMLTQSGIAASQIEVKIVDGGRRLAKILLQEAKKLQAGTIVLGRRGMNEAQDYSLGSNTRKVLNQAEDMAVWIIS